MKIEKNNRDNKTERVCTNEGRKEIDGTFMCFKIEETKGVRKNEPDKSNRAKKKNVCLKLFFRKSCGESPQNGEP